MYEFFNWLLTFFLQVPTTVWVLILGAAGVSLLSQLLKRWFKIENERWVFALVMGIALVGSALDWFLTASNLPPTIIGVQTSLLVGIAQPIYFYVIKPLNLIIAGYKANKEAIKKKLAELETAPIVAPIDTLQDTQTVVEAVQNAATEATAIVTPQATPVEGAVVDFEQTPKKPVVADF